MFTQTQAFLNTQFNCLALGQCDAVARCFAPVVVVAYLGTNIILRGSEQAAEFLRNHMANSAALGLSAAVPKVLSINLHRGVRFKANVEIT